MAFSATLQARNDGNTSFSSAWQHIRKNYPNLYEFCNGLAIDYPGNATVESDLSSGVYKKNNDYRSCLSSLALEVSYL